MSTNTTTEHFTPGIEAVIDGRPVTVARVNRDSAGQIVVVGIARGGGVAIGTFGAPQAVAFEPHSVVWLTPENGIWMFDSQD